MIYAKSLKEIEVIARWRGIETGTLKRVCGIWEFSYEGQA